MKKKILTVASFVLVAALAIAGTVAYFTDRDSEVNTFTVGNVEIDLEEEFEQDSELIPGVKIEKEATIANTGENDAWVWMTIAVPSALDDAEGNLGVTNVLHWNVPGCFWNGFHDKDKYIQSGIKDGYLPEGSTGVSEDKTWIVSDDVVKETIDGVAYNVYALLYKGAIEPDEVTNIGLSRVYLDSKVDINTDGQWYIVENGETTEIDWNSNEDGAPRVYVSAYAIQKEGFDTVEEAYEAYQTQWGDNGVEWGKEGFVVNNSEELAVAIEAGETKIWLNPNTYNMPAAAKGKTLIFNGTTDSIIEVVPTPSASEAGGQLDYNLDGSTVTFNGVTIKTNSMTYAGYARMSGTYNNCVIQNTYSLGLKTVNVFNNCVFNITNEYLRTNGAASVDFNNCTFNTAGRAILVFQDGSSHLQTVTVKDCTFNATAAANTWNGIHVSAVSIDGTYGTYTVNLEGNNTVDSDFNGLWQIKAGEANVTVNDNDTAN